MRKLISAAALACALALLAVADFKVEKDVAAPAEAPSAVKDSLEPQGVRVLNDAGSPYIEVWFSKSVAAESKPPAGDVFYPGIPEGSFLGIARFVSNAADFRGQAIKPGLYSMRYALMPVDGNHVGAADSRDFILMVPLSAETNTAQNVKFEDVVAMSRKASGTGHPAVFPMKIAEGGDAGVTKTSDGHVVLKSKLGKSAAPVAFVVYGKSDH